MDGDGLTATAARDSCTIAADEAGDLIIPADLPTERVDDVFGGGFDPAVLGYGYLARVNLGHFWDGLSAPAAAIAGFAAKAVWDEITRGRERRQARFMRFLDTALEAATSFMVAAGQAANDHVAFLQASLALRNSQNNGIEGSFDFQRAYDDRVEEQVASFRQAEHALISLKLLCPSVAGPARTYLDACKAASWPEDRDAAERARLGQDVETIIRSSFDADGVFRPGPGKRIRQWLASKLLGRRT